MPEAWVQSRSGEDALEEEMATHSSIPAWKIPQIEETGRLPSLGSQTDMTKHTHTHTHTHTHDNQESEISSYMNLGSSSNLLFHQYNGKLIIPIP